MAYCAFCIYVIRTRVSAREATKRKIVDEHACGTDRSRSGWPMARGQRHRALPCSSRQGSFAVDHGRGRGGSIPLSWRLPAEGGRLRVVETWTLAGKGRLRRCESTPSGDPGSDQASCGGAVERSIRASNLESSRRCARDHSRTIPRSSWNHAPGAAVIAVRAGPSS